MNYLVDQIATIEDAAVLLRHRTRVGRSLGWRRQEAAIAGFFSAAIELAAAIRHHLGESDLDRVRRWVCYGDTMVLPTARIYAARRATESLLADLLGWSSDPVLHLHAPSDVAFDVLDPVAAGLCDRQDTSIAIGPLSDVALDRDDVLVLMPGTDIARELLEAGRDHAVWRHVDAGGAVIGLSSGLAQMAATTALFELHGDALRQPALLPLPNFERPDRPPSVMGWHLGQRTQFEPAHPDRVHRIKDLVTLAWSQPIPDEEVEQIGQLAPAEPTMVRLLWGYWANSVNGRLHLELNAGDEHARSLVPGWFVGTGQGVPISVMAEAVHPSDPLPRRLQWAADVFGAAGPMPWPRDLDP